MRFHEVVHDIYFDDLDAFQVLHNARYLLLFERAIGAFWRHLGFGTLLDAQRDPDQFHLVRSNHVEYKRPVFGAGTVRVRVCTRQPSPIGWVRRVPLTQGGTLSRHRSGPPMKVVSPSPE